MRRLASPSWVFVLLPLLLAGCFQPTPTYLTDWDAERAAHGTMGVEATMDLSAEEYVVVGEGELLETEAPFTILPGMHTTRSGHVLFFHGTIIGVGSGLIVLEGEEIRLTEGLLSQVPIDHIKGDGDQVTAYLRPDSPPEKPTIDVEPDLDELRSALFFSDGAVVAGRDLVVEAADRARIIMEGNATDLTLPIRFDADYLAIHPSGSLEFAAVDATFPAFGYGGTTQSGTVALTDRADIDAPTAVFGSETTLRFTPSGVASTAPFRLTQAATADGYVLEAAVQLHAAEDEVEVAAGNTSWSKVHYRETGYAGSAILANITVTGDAAALVRVPLASPPWIVDTLWQEVRDGGWAGLFMAPWVALASPWLLIGEALLKGFDCVFNDCPSDHPYPAWMEPGEIGRFYYQVDATEASPGIYEGTIVFRGANHETQELPVRIVVTAD